jgi:hypothetical protein
MTRKEYREEPIGGTLVWCLSPGIPSCTKLGKKKLCINRIGGGEQKTFFFKK